MLSNSVRSRSPAPPFGGLGETFKRPRLLLFGTDKSFDEIAIESRRGLCAKHRRITKQRDHDKRHRQTEHEN